MDNLNFPNDTNSDIVHSSTKALLNLIPIVGGSVSEIFSMLVSPPIEKRRNKWMQEVVAALQNLESKRKGIVQELANNEEFASLLISASLNAFKTHISDKHKKLRNGLINSITNEQGYDINQIFITFIDELTITHLKVLQLVNQNEFKTINGDTYQKIYNILVENNAMLSGTVKKIDLITFRFLLKDLESKGLLFISPDIGEIENQVSSSSFLITEDSDSDLPFLKVTDFGTSFLKFVEAQ